MKKLLYVLGWIGIASLPVAIIVIIITTVSGTGGSIWPLLIWTPFVFIKGLLQVREYRNEMKIDKILNLSQESEHDNAR